MSLFVTSVCVRVGWGIGLRGYRVDDADFAHCFGLAAWMGGNRGLGKDGWMGGWMALVTVVRMNE